MAWQKGPMPKDTYGWGGVVKHPYELHGFQFADFRGDHVILVNTLTDGHESRVEPHEVAWYDNSLELPPEPEK